MLGWSDLERGVVAGAEGADASALSWWLSLERAAMVLVGQCVNGDA